MADPDTVSRFVARLEIALQAGHFDLCRRIIDQTELESTTPADAITLDTSLADVGLPMRVVGLLERAGVHSIGDALARTPDQLREIPSVGPNAVREIVATLRASTITTAVRDDD